MKISKKLLPLSVAVAAASLSGHSFGWGWDATNNTPSGGGEREFHAFYTGFDCGGAGMTGPTSSCGVGAIPGILSGGEIKVTFEFASTQFLEAGGGGAGPGGSSFGTQTARTYSSADPAPNGNPTFILNQGYYPICHASGACSAESDGTANTVLGGWNVDVDVSGKILDGYIFADTLSATLGQIIGFASISNGVVDQFCLWSGVSTNFTQAQVDAMVDGSATCEATVGTTGGTTSWIGTSQMDYITAPVSDSSKAVPMPAFAAAALGLGLVGVTLVTSGRRKVKA